MTSESIPLLEPSPSDAPGRRPPRAGKLTKQGSPHSRRRMRKADRRLVEGLLERNPASWAEFMRRYERLIVSRVLSTCREVGMEPQPDLVEDCGGEVMARLFHDEMAGLRRFQGRSKLSTWLAIVVRRTTLGVLRRRQRDANAARRPDSRFDLATVPDRPGAVSAADAEDHARLQSCLEKLSASDRLVLALQYEQKLSYAEIGSILGISENAVGPKLHRAQSRLKKLMKRA